ncbi:MAG: type II toxin-antitoxin system VapC family toxin [Bacteroidetes bacterium]|nr:MAG: type II toxin-antitoxin system VapC family toxin [Bacteroidota bacterium]
MWKLREEYNYIAISAISVFELFAGATDKQKENDVKVLLKWLDIIDLNDEIAEMCGKILIKLRKCNKLIEYRDLFIGVSALFYDLKLVTLNIRHFDRIPELEIIKNP